MFKMPHRPQKCFLPSFQQTVHTISGLELVKLSPEIISIEVETSLKTGFSTLIDIISGEILTNSKTSDNSVEKVVEGG